MHIFIAFVVDYTEHDYFILCMYIHIYCSWRAGQSEQCLICFAFCLAKLQQSRWLSPKNLGVLQPD